MKKYVYLIVVLFLSVSCSKEEHEYFATIYGIVSDYASNEPLGNATVVLSPGGVTKTTDDNGYFEFPDLTPQQYTITVQKTGYRSNRKSVIAVVNERTETNMLLTMNQQN